MVVYDITSEKSFENVQMWLKKISKVSLLAFLFGFIIFHLCFKYANKHVCKMVIGNKCDEVNKRAIQVEKAKNVSVFEIK